MEPDSTTTYEGIRDIASSLERASDPSSRRLVWVTAEHSLALARDREGRLEIFVPGEPLVATLRAVSDVLEHQVWKSDGDEDLAASRIVLPPGEHFDQFGAVLGVELLDHGLHADRQAAFSAVETLISLALRRELVTNETMMGLIGELVLLEGLLAAAPASRNGDLLRSWAGSGRSARDFQIGSVGVEVKTTQGSASIHHVQGVHQLELGHSNNGVAETDLFLLSLGLGWVAEPGQGRSLPEVVESLLQLVLLPEDRQDLLARIKQYGGDAAIGYDHATDANKLRYATRFYFRFERLYDLTDDRMRLLTSSELAGLVNVDPGSVQFRIMLNDRIRGVHNPAVGWNRSVKRILESVTML